MERLTCRAISLCLVRMCDAIPELVTSLAVHPAFPRLTTFSQCRHCASRKSPDDSFKIRKKVFYCATFKWLEVVPPRTALSPLWWHSFLNVLLLSPLAVSWRWKACILSELIQRSAFYSIHSLKCLI